MLSLEGQQLGNYDVIRRIRMGGMGAVYEGRQRTAFDRRVAIKVILGNYASDREMQRRFAREARTVARLHHPHILPLIEFGDEQGVLYLVMPFIEGGTLTNHLRQSLPDLSEVAAIYQQLLDAVEYAHDEGLIHRDIKSSNVLLEHRRSGPPYVYLADFGLVRTSRQAELEQTGKPIPLDQVPGTPHYMAPEQTRGIVTTSTDIYALGVLLYQMLTGKLPYDDDDDVHVIQMHMHAPIPSPCDHDASIPSELGEVVRTAMAKRAEDRFDTVAALRAAFLGAVKGPIVTVQEDEPPIPDPIYLPPKRPASMPLASPRRPISMPLAPQTSSSPQESPAPMMLPRRLRNIGNATPLVVVREGNRQRVTDTVRNKPRITEEPVHFRSMRFTGSMLAAMGVPVVLLILLIMPHVLGISFFPSGFPLFGTPPVATVLVTPQNKMLQDKYVLTASPQVKAPDLATHTIPDRIAQSTFKDGRTVQTTGTRSITGTQSHGYVVFTNSNEIPVTVSMLVLTTPSGVRVQTTQEVEVPAHTNGQDGKMSASAVAVDPGIAGNIPAHALDGTCCNNGVSARNPSPFSGGTDAQTVHLVAQADLDGVQSALTPQLQRHVAQQLQSLLNTDEVMVGQPTYAMTVSSSSPVGSQVDQVQVQVGVSGTVTIYNRNVASHTAAQLLSKLATLTLASAYQLRGAPSVATPRIVYQGKNGVIYLSVSVHGLWVYVLTPQQTSQWPQSIRGATLAAALVYLKAQPGVATAQIYLPFGADHVPSSVEEIKIVLGKFS